MKASACKLDSEWRMNGEDDKDRVGSYDGLSEWLDPLATDVADHSWSCCWTRSMEGVEALHFEASLCAIDDPFSPARTCMRSKQVFLEHTVERDCRICTSSSSIPTDRCAMLEHVQSLFFSECSKQSLKEREISAIHLPVPSSAPFSLNLQFVSVTLTARIIAKR